MSAGPQLHRYIYGHASWPNSKVLRTDTHESLDVDLGGLTDHCGCLNFFSSGVCWTGLIQAKGVCQLCISFCHRSQGMVEIDACISPGNSKN